MCLAPEETARVKGWGGEGEGRAPPSEVKGNGRGDWEEGHEWDVK